MRLKPWHDIKRRPLRYLLSIPALLTLLSPALKAQDYGAQNTFLYSESQQVIDEWNIRHPNVEFHSGYRPYLLRTLAGFNDTMIGYDHFSVKNRFLSRTFNDAPGRRNQFNVQLFPILDDQVGYDGLKNQVVNEFAGGAHVKVNINNDFTFAATVIGGQASYANATDTFVKSTGLIPGLGMAYAGTQNKNVYTYANFSGYISYNPSKAFNVQLGKDKHFIGDGYRSLLLSDVANNNPYLGINANLWHLQYSVWYCWMSDLSVANGLKQNINNKFGAFHYLSWNVVKEFNIGFFENIVWQGTDKNRSRSFDPNYLNPVVLYRPQEYSVGSPDNAFIGINLSAKLFKRLKVYGQLAADEFYLKEIRAGNGWWANKQGWQFGAKYLDAFGQKNLTLQLEYNEVRPYTYSHGSVEQNYAQYGQALAHPMGANFKEVLGIVNYRKGRWMLNNKMVYAIIGKDSAGINYGQDIFRSYTTRPYDYGHYTTQGLKTFYFQNDLCLTWWALPQMNLRLELGYIQTNMADIKGLNLQDPYFYFGLKTSLWNFYRDF